MHGPHVEHQTVPRGQVPGEYRVFFPVGVDIRDGFKTLGMVCVVLAADEFEKHYIETGTGYISRRMRAMVNAAIKTFYKVKAEQQGYVMDKERDLMLLVCKGEIKSDSDLVLARKQDASLNEG